MSSSSACASSTQLPLQISSDQLQFGKATIPLKTATLFSAEHDANTVHVYCHKKVNDEDYQTTFCIFLKNGENMQAAIQAFLNNTKLKANLFYVRSLSVETTTAVPQIRFQFMRESEAKYFEKYCAPLFPQYTLTTQVIPNSDNIHEITIHLTNGSMEETTQKVNAVFHQIREKSYGLDQALRQLNDPRFPTPPEGAKYTMDVTSYRDHVRNYNVTEGGVEETMRVMRDTVVSRPADMAKLHRWLEHPVSLKGMGEQEYRHYLEMLLADEFKQKKRNNQKIQPLMEAVLNIPGFDLVNFMNSLAINEAEQKK